jgi:uncharacterized protein (UPF0335 family)
MSARLEPGERWQRLRTYLFIWLAVVLVPLFGGQLVHLALAALTAAVFTVVWWWLSEVGAVTDAADWTAESRGSSRGRGADPRASRLHRQVRDVLQRNTGVGSDVILGQTLLEVIDDRARALHGIDRAADPERFAAIAGADLDAFVRAVATGRTTVNAGQLPDLISRIERL